jgi:hypothetical protein
VVVDHRQRVATPRRGRVRQPISLAHGGDG